MPTVYKICARAEWEAAQRAGAFRGAAIDRRDGYIHLSSAGQVEETAARHFAGQDALVLVAIDAAALGEALRWETSRGGALFPHLYGELPMLAVEGVWDLPHADGGGFRFPPLRD